MDFGDISGAFQGDSTILTDISEMSQDDLGALRWFTSVSEMFHWILGTFPGISGGFIWLQRFSGMALELLEIFQKCLWKKFES